MTWADPKRSFRGAQNTHKNTVFLAFRTIWQAFRELGTETKAFLWTLSCAHEEHRLGDHLGHIASAVGWAPEPSSAPLPKACEKDSCSRWAIRKQLPPGPWEPESFSARPPTCASQISFMLSHAKKHRRLSPRALGPVPRVCGRARPNSCYVQSFGKYFRLAPGTLNPFPRVHEHASKFWQGPWVPELLSAPPNACKNQFRLRKSFAKDVPLVPCAPETFSAPPKTCKNKSRLGKTISKTFLTGHLGPQTLARTPMDMKNQISLMQTNTQNKSELQIICGSAFAQPRRRYPFILLALATIVYHGNPYRKIYCFFLFPTRHGGTPCCMWYVAHAMFPRIVFSFLSNRAYGR